jgi:hypothetical protein
MFAPFRDHRGGADAPEDGSVVCMIPEKDLKQE